MESPTWRANADWGERLGYTADELAGINRRSIEMLHALRQQFQSDDSPIVVSGCIGPRGDGYAPAQRMTALEAQNYHSAQVEVFASTTADMIGALTLNYVDEAVGIARAARRADMPVAISFTTETDGRLPDGTSLQNAIEQTDAETEAYPAYYMINCAHPAHFESALLAGEAWTKRLRGIRANASRKSHAELDNSETLDRGDPEELGELLAALHRRHPQLTVLGGCCGTDHQHIEAIDRCC